MSTLMDKIAQHELLCKLIKLDENGQQIVKLLSEKLEDTTTNLSLAVRSLLIAARDSLEQVEQGLQWNDPSTVMPSMRPIWKWYHENFHTGKVGGTGYGIRTSLINLMNEHPRIAQLMGKDIKDIINSPEMPRDSEARVGAETKMFLLIDMLCKVMPKINPTMSNVCSELLDTTNNLKDSVKKLRAIKPQDSGIESSRTSSTPKGPVIASQQNQQVEVIVNQVLQSLPKDVAAKIRAVVAKSDNKLATLQQQMAANNVSM